MIPHDDAWLQSRCLYWQEVLRLQDWRIHAVFVRPWDMSNKDRNPEAEVNRDAFRKHARIKVLQLTDLSPVCDFPDHLDPLERDVEVNLVHELLHISLDLCDRAVPDSVDHPWSMFEIGQEQHIVNVSKALVLLDRAKQQRPVIPTESGGRVR